MSARTRSRAPAARLGSFPPEFDVPLKNARWEVYLPPDYDYQDFWRHDDA